ncbi:MAG: hypothetical protein JSS66_05085 [Armatimonadetes bacterium]|nr:hypothetical protein [Armatimonadota bacterium]
MSTLLTELTGIGSLPTYRYSVDNYDQDKLGLGPLMIQNTGAGEEDKWLGPMPVGLIRPFEYSTSLPAVFPWAMQWSATRDWVFLADNAAAAATRRIMLATFDRDGTGFNIAGFITLTLPTATNHTIRGMRMTYDKHTSGTVAVSGTAVTGTSTTWSTDGVCAGNRIGFGSTDPTQISQWYEITAVGSNTGITIDSSAGTIGSGTSYVIEDLRAIVLTTNATAANGGLFVAKGLRKEIFSPTGTNIAAATTTDNLRAVYWLADASTVTNTTGAGLAIEPASSKTSHTIWALDGTSTITLFKYNLRASLGSLSSGKSTSAFVFKTAASTAITGTASQANNGRYASLNHGPGSGSGCIYFTSTTRIYRSKATSNITSNDSTWLSAGDSMVEIPPGSVNTIGASSLMNSLEYSSSLDKFIVAVNATTTPFRSYVTQYRTDSGQMDRLWGCDIRQIDQSTADSGTTPAPSMTGGPYSLWSEGGMLYAATIGATAILNRVYAIPLSADWEYTSSTNSFIVTPRMACPNADKFVRVYTNEAEVIAGATGHNLGLAPEPYRISYRVNGISDNSGGWTMLNQTGDLSAVPGTDYIQFKLEFRTMGIICIPARILSLGVAYTDLSTDSHYQFSTGQTNLTNKRFAWRFSTAFASSVPALRVRLYDAVSGSLLVDDNTSSATGTFERSTDGGNNWSSWNNTDKGNETTYIRYTPASLGDNIKVRPLLTQL